MTYCPSFRAFLANVAYHQHFALAVSRLPARSDGGLTRKWEIMPVCYCVHECVFLSSRVQMYLTVGAHVCLCMISWKSWASLWNRYNGTILCVARWKSSLCQGIRDLTLDGIPMLNFALLQMISDISWHWGQPCSQLWSCGKPFWPTPAVLSPFKSHYLPHRNLQCIFHQMSHYNL